MAKGSSGKRRTFSPEFKQEAVRLVASGAAPISQIARELGVHVETLRLWRRQAGPARGSGPVPSPVTGLEEENRRLRRENTRLREERDILKKATADSRAPRREVRLDRAPAVGARGALAVRGVGRGAGNQLPGPDERPSVHFQPAILCNLSPVMTDPP